MHKKPYYVNHYQLYTFQYKLLTIMHNKMDYAKIVFLFFFHKSEELYGLVKLIVLVTIMIVHGHVDMQYVHYGLYIFLYNSNHTIESKIITILAGFGIATKVFFDVDFLGSRSTTLFCVVLKDIEMCKVLLPLLQKRLILAMPLPPILYMWLDNAMKNNKNKYMLCYWFDLVANKIFRKM